MPEVQGHFVGAYLGNYQVLRLLGTGGFAEVYLGIHKHLETYAAIKVVHTQIKVEEQQSFIQEARTIARLRHPNIVPILEFGIQEEVPYLVMYYSPNGTLRQYYRRGQAVPLSQCLPHLRQVASALQYAHDNRIIHRDVKPDNMLLGEKGEVFLSDFGIAAQAHSSRSQTVEEVIGTVRYMAPEQLRGKPRPASDQYSLAIITYEWLCGQPPFQGTTYLDIARQHVMTPPRSLREQSASISANVERVILTALEKDPHQRYVRIQDFIDALEEAQRSDHYIGPASFQMRQPDRTPPALANAAAMGLSGTLTSSMTALPGNTVIDGSPLTATRATFDQIVPTVSRIPSQTNGPAAIQQARKRLSRRAALGVVTGAVLLGGASLAWIEMTHRSSDLKSTTTPTPSVPLLFTYQAQGATIAAVSCSPDGKYIVSASAGNNVTNNIHTWEATTGKMLWTTSMEWPVIAATWSPDGHAIAVDGSDDSDLSIDLTLLLSTKDGQIISRNVDQQQIDNGPYDTVLPESYAISWSPNGKHLAIACDRGVVGIWDGIHGHAAERYATGDVQKKFSAVAWSPDGKRIIGGTSSGYIYQWKIGNPVQATYTYQMNQANTADLAWSPDGKYIAAANIAAIQLWDSNGGTSYKGNYLSFAAPLAWSPNGKYIASANTDRSNFTIVIWETQTGKVVNTCKGHTASITALAWSKQGDMLVSGSQDQTVRVWHFKAE